VTAKIPHLTLKRLARVGRSEVALPLGQTLFPAEVLASAAGRFPDAVRLVDGQLVLSAVPGGPALLREVLRHLYQASL